MSSARAPGSVTDRARPCPAFQKGLHLSTARALLFNAVLAYRVEAGNWDRLIDGDVPLDGAPTGPLWGRGRAQARDAALNLETAALANIASGSIRSNTSASLRSAACSCCGR